MFLLILINLMNKVPQSFLLNKWKVSRKLKTSISYLTFLTVFSIKTSSKNPALNLKAINYT